MNFSIVVGDVEKHIIDFNFNQLLGRLVIKVNQTEVKRQVKLIDEPLKESHVIQVGNQERLTVRIEKRRKQLLGQKCSVFLNNRLLQCYEGI